MPSRLVFDTHSNVKAEAACLRKHHIEEKAPLNRKESETTSSRRRAAASLLAILPQWEERNAFPTRRISKWTVPLRSFSAWVDVKTHSFGSELMGIAFLPRSFPRFKQQNGYN